MKMPLKIDITMFAPCGMNCVVCYKHCYHKKPCAGCLNTVQGNRNTVENAGIKDCSRNSGFSYCFECSDYPCKLITNLEKSYNKDIRQALWRIVNICANMDWKHLHNNRKRNILVQNVEESYQFMIENAASVKKN